MLDLRGSDMLAKGIEMGSSLALAFDLDCVYHCIVSVSIPRR